MQVLERGVEEALLVDPRVSRSGGRRAGRSWLEPSSVCGGRRKETLQKQPPQPKG